MMLPVTNIHSNITDVSNMTSIITIAEQVQQPQWKAILVDLCKTYGNDIDQARRNSTLEVYPLLHQVFDAFNYCDLQDLKVVIIGQDTYQNPGLANGLAFSVPNTAPLPPSLRNIFKEIEAEFGTFRSNTELYDWAKQGVLLLNRALTVEQFQSNSHARFWLKFTEDLIRTINQRTKNIVYMLWGNFAQGVEDIIDKEHNLILKHTHPSPLSRKPFVGNNHFILANDYLSKHDKAHIRWVN